MTRFNKEKKGVETPTKQGSKCYYYIVYYRIAIYK